MNRRAVLGGVAAVLCTADRAHAQSRTRPARIAYLAERGAPNEFEQSFLRGLRERGLIEGEHLIIDFRWAAGDPLRLKVLAAEALAAAPALVVATDGASVRAVQAIDNTTAIVHPVMGDPIVAGYSGSFSRPDRNVTGVSVLASELGPKRVELLKEAVPGLQRLGVLFNVVRQPRFGAATHAAAEAFGLTAVEMRVAMPGGIEAGFETAVRQGVQAIVVVSDTSTITHRKPLADAALRHRLPAIYANRTYLRGGGLMSYGPDLEAAFHRAAYFVERILKGARPADLPIEQPQVIHLALNLRAAKALEFSFPTSLQLRADEFIR